METNFALGWTCAYCTFHNNHALSTCELCSLPKFNGLDSAERTASLKTSSDQQHSVGWNCNTCTYHNDVETKACSACGALNESKRLKEDKTTVACPICKVELASYLLDEHLALHQNEEHDEWVRLRVRRLDWPGKDLSSLFQQANDY